MKQLVEILTKSLVDQPELVRIEEQQDEHGLIFRVHVPHADLGKVIGRQGRIAKAIRTLVKAAAAKDHHKRVMVEFV